MLEPRIRFRASSLPASGVALLDAPKLRAAPSAYDPALVLAFAKAIVRPGGRAKLIAPDNTTLPGWCSIEDAAKQGAFLIETAPEILPIDCDEPELAPRVSQLAAELKSEGVTPVVLASGGPGHRHLFARIDDPARRARFAARAKTLGLQVKPAIRPPLAPHRLGLRVELLEPSDPHVALAALEPSVRHRPGQLTARIANLLRHGDREGRYTERGKRSAVVMAIVTGMVNAGWTFEDGFRELRDPRNRGGEKVQRRSEWLARRYVAASWREAEKFVVRRPAIRDRTAVLDRISELRDAADAHRWPGRTGATKGRVMATHLATAMGLGKLQYELSERAAAEGAGCTRKVARAAQRELIDEGWLILVRRGSGSRPSVWRLGIAKEGPDQTTPDTSVPGRTKVPQTGLPQGGDGNVWGSKVRPDPAADVWRWGALGGYAWRVWAELVRPQRSTEIAGRLKLDPRVVRRILRRLEQWGLSVKADGIWRRGPASLEDVAVRLKVAGSGRVQRSVHDGEREEDRMRLAQYRAERSKR